MLTQSLSQQISLLVLVPLNFSNRPHAASECGEKILPLSLELLCWYVYMKHVQLYWGEQLGGRQAEGGGGRGERKGARMNSGSNTVLAKEQKRECFLVYLHSMVAIHFTRS